MFKPMIAVPFVLAVMTGCAGSDPAPTTPASTQTTSGTTTGTSPNGSGTVVDPHTVGQSGTQALSPTPMERTDAIDSHGLPAPSNGSGMNGINGQNGTFGTTGATGTTGNAGTTTPTPGRTTR